MLFIKDFSIILAAPAGLVSVALASQSDPQRVLQAPTPSTAPLAAACVGHRFPEVVCIQRYGSVIHGDFERKVRNVLGDADTYPSTSTPEEPSFSHLADARFLMFDEGIGCNILGPSPTVEFMFQLTDVSHEGPVYCGIQRFSC